MSDWNWHAYLLLLCRFCAGKTGKRTWNRDPAQGRNTSQNHTGLYKMRTDKEKPYMSVVSKLHWKIKHVNKLTLVADLIHKPDKQKKSSFRRSLQELHSLNANSPAILRKKQGLVTKQWLVTQLIPAGGARFEVRVFGAREKNFKIVLITLHLDFV